MENQINIAIIGTRFMGRAHSNAWANVATHFNLAQQPVMKIACGRKIDDRLRAICREIWLGLLSVMIGRLLSQTRKLMLLISALRINHISRSQWLPSNLGNM
jgi:hypothetical protein